MTKFIQCQSLYVLIQAGFEVVEMPASVPKPVETLEGSNTKKFKDGFNSLRHRLVIIIYSLVIDNMNLIVNNKDQELWNKNEFKRRLFSKHSLFVRQRVIMFAK